MSNEPANPKLWNMLVAQARTKFKTYPSLPASKWVHSEYVKKGGQFVSSKSITAAKKASEKSRRRGKDKDAKK